MAKIILNLAISIFLLNLSLSASAEDKLLTCANKSGNMVFQICGIRGCPVTVKLGNKITNYNLNRKKNNDGSLSYSQRSGFRPTCKIEISRLSLGQRKVVSASCASKLVDSTCKFTSVGASSSSTGTSQSSSSVGNSSSSSNSSEDDDSSSSKSSSSRSSSKGSDD